MSNKKSSKEKETENRLHEEIEKAKENHIKAKGWWASKTKGQKVSFIISISLFVIAIAIVFMYIFCRQFFGDEIGDEILGPGVENGFVLFGRSLVDSSEKWLLTAMFTAVFFFIGFIANFIVRITTIRGKRAKTVGSLVNSCLKYVLVIAWAASVLIVWGLDVATVVASLGVVTLIIGLGCQSLIADVVSGLFSVFDDYFSIGDVVIIDGFRGNVIEIGMRSVKIQDWAGNIKSIANSSITTVTNLSRTASAAQTTIDISYKEDIARVEAIIAKELPNIKKSLPKVIGDIYYKGVSGFTSYSVQLFFIAFANEDDRFQVQRDLNREILVLLQKNGVEMPLTPVPLTKAKDQDEYKKASSEDKEISKMLNDLNRLIPDDVEDKPSFLKKVSKAIVESAEKMSGINEK